MSANLENSAVATGLESQFSLQSQRWAMPKNVQVTVQLHSFYMLAKLSWKSFKLGFRSMWTEKSQMHKLSLEKAEEPEIKLPTWFTGSWIEQGNPRINIYFCFIDYDKAFDCVYHKKLLKILKEMNYQAIWPVSWETCMQVRKQQLELDMCRGPAPADPGYSKERRHRRGSGNNCLIKR